MINICFLFFVIFTFSTAQFFDTTCDYNRCTFSRMSQVNYAKTLAIGEYSCIIVATGFSPNRTIAYSVSDIGSLSVSFDQTIGALYDVTHFPTFNVTIIVKEYCNGQSDDACITASSEPDRYLLSKDQTRGPIGNTWRSIGFYDFSVNKILRGIQNFHPTSYGGLIIATNFDSDQHISSSSLITCTHN